MLKKNLLILILLLFPITLIAKDNAENPKFDKWTEKLRKDAKNEGHEEEFLDSVFKEIFYSDEYVAQDKKQFDPQTFKQYYENAVNRFRIRKAKKQIKKNEGILTKIEQDFLVPKQYIVSLWAIETDFGRVTGNYNVFNSLANLSFDERRRSLFLKEFLAALEVIKVNQIQAADLSGSWAGAIGQCQFLPSTYLNHGFDFNEDNKIDIWKDKEDVLASIANYLQSLGWNNQVPWGYEIKNIKGLSESFNFKESHALQYLVGKYNIEKLNGSKFSDYELSRQVKATIQGNRLFITFKNFDLIKEWNNSTYFALTVGLLSDKIDK